MSIGASLVLIAVGAVIRWAVKIHWKANTVNWNLIGDILIAVGVLGLLISLFWMANSNRRTVVADRRDDIPPTPPTP